jgi:hypothetical protein
MAEVESSQVSKQAGLQASNWPVMNNLCQDHATCTWPGHSSVLLGWASYIVTLPRVCQVLGAYRFSATSLRNSSLLQQLLHLVQMQLL